jgi:hypothetical protein
MKITFEVDGVIASIEDLDNEYNSINQALDLCLHVLKAAGFQDESIKIGIKKLNQELNN